MRTSEAIGELAKALAKAQAEMEDPEMGGLGQVGGGKSAARKYPYALLTDVLKVARAALGKNGIMFTQTVDVDRNVMVTRLQHSSGQWLEGDYPMSPRNSDPQKQGSANTYARRYALMSILGVAGEKDDDGASAKPSSKVDTAAIHDAGAADGRKWLVAQLLKPAADGYSGAGFASALKKAGVAHSLEHIKLFCLWMGKAKPSMMEPGQREALVGFLAGQGATKWAEFVSECGPLPVPKKKAKAKAPAVDFETAVGALGFKVGEVAKWCQEKGWGDPLKWTAKKQSGLVAALGEEDGEKAGEYADWLDNERGA